MNSTILYWLELQPGTFLELESGEDIDIIRADASEPSEDVARLLNQLKQLSEGSLTLRHRDALKSVANFCGHRDSNPNWNLRFRFVTTLPIGQERDDWHFSPSAVRTWESIRTGESINSERAAGIEALRAFLFNREKPLAFSEETWATFTRTVSGESRFTFSEIVDTFEWAAGNGDYLSVKGQVLTRLRASLPDVDEAALSTKFNQLFAFVFERLCEPGSKTLDVEALQEQLRATAVSSQYLTATLTLASRLEALETRVANLEQRADEHDERLRGHDETLAGLTQQQDGLLKTFYSAEEFFASQSSGTALYDLDQQLRGRGQTREDLDEFLRNDQLRIAVIEGSGGIGKTKILHDWSIGKTDWIVCWTGPNIGVWHTGTANEIPAGNVLLIADDGHRYDDLEQLTTLASTWDGPQHLKLVIAVRRSDNNHLRQALSRIDENAIRRIPILGPLSHDDVVALAREVLGQEAGGYAERLAKVSADSPFITVVGGRLIAQGKITPELLNNDAQFQHRVFDSLARQYEGTLPSGRYTKREFMEFIAALQPVKETDDSFIEKTAEFLNLKNSEVRRGFGSLETSGVLTRKRKGSSVIPDLLADYLLGQASLEEDGRPTEFADEVFEAFEGSHFGNLLKNLAVLDWRVAQRDDSSRLLDKIWERLSVRFKTEDARERKHTLRALEPVAVYLSGRIHKLGCIAMDEPTTNSNVFNLYRVTRERVLEQLPQFFGVTIFHETTSQDAFDRLWRLAQHDNESVHNRSQRVLQEAIGYGVGKDLIFSSHVLSMVETLAQNPDAYDGLFSPLDMLDKLMVWEIDHTEWVGRSFQNSVHTIIHSSVRSLRQRVFRVVESCLSSDSPKIANRAARSLSKIISVFIPMRRDRETDEERAWHDAERVEALQIVQRRIEAGRLTLATVWKFKEILRTAAEEDRQSPGVRQQAVSLESRLELPELFWLFHILCTDEWCHNTLEDGFYVVSERRRIEERLAIEELVRIYPEPDARVRATEALVQQARAASIDPVCIDSFLSSCAIPHPSSSPFLIACWTRTILSSGRLLVSQLGLGVDEIRRNISTTGRRISRTPTNEWSSQLPVRYAAGPSYRM